MPKLCEVCELHEEDEQPVVRDLPFEFYLCSSTPQGVFYFSGPRVVGRSVHGVRSVEAP